VIAEYAINILVGYLFGSIPFGVVIGYLWTGKDIRQSGSGKMGATNVLRTAGKLPALLTVLADPLKGVAPALVGKLLFDDMGVAAAGAGAAIVGHLWPVFAGFRGGRGVTVAFGGLLVLAPFESLGVLALAAVIVVATRYVSLMSIVAAAAAAVVMVVAAVVGWAQGAAALYAVLAVLVIEVMHIPNMRRLLAGTEPRIGRGGDRPATG
jgi:glycerol-3-phosphate acyltransferase PlsY